MKKISKSKSFKGILETFLSKANFDMHKIAGFKDIVVLDICVIKE